MTRARKELGQHGEMLAAEFLKSRGFHEISRNLSLKVGEIDLLMEEGDTIVVVEVKTQTSNQVLDPIYKITPAKQRKLRLLARLVAARHPSRNIRIDVVTLYWKPNQSTPVITHYPNIL